MVKNGQIPVTIFRAFCKSISWITASGSSRTDKISNTVCRQLIIVIIQVALVRSTSFKPVVFNSSYTTESWFTIRYLASIGTKLTYNTIFGSGQIFWKTKCSPAALMYLSYLRPNNIKMFPDTSDTKANGIRNIFRIITAVFTCTHILKICVICACPVGPEDCTGVICGLI